ncbi:MAG: hydroxypyruvate isomerase [SAR202 cluster bacterium]|jgi:hydroxypyruvate isomerase|nr:hydroxypyruvate isomerase [SAR202 cluster bacterium]MDP6273095.1 hydroxypyruvate isomerase [Dehalococcoidia bacterium]MDP7414656.1 hydroxypyruvate isomerase [SAR202 cluster bacterium]|tara:strand:- start:14569 stop:15348 length:780 start_codon:yes stop_codon:yes gene_type:complete
MPKFAANLTMLYNEVDFLDRFAAAASAGFKGVEYLFPYDYDKDLLAELLAKHGLTQVLHNLPAGDWGAGDRGNACDPDRVGEFQEGVGRAVEYARTLGCPMVNCLAGIPPRTVSADKVHSTLIGNLQFAAAELEAAGIRMLIEPINTIDIPGFHITSTKQGRSIINDTGSGNLFLQQDIYHMQIMEGDLARTIQANLDIIRHMQIADNPGRNEPGTGEINYPYLFEAIDEMDYDGWIGCEYKPKTTTEEGLGWASAYLG